MRYGRELMEQVGFTAECYGYGWVYNRDEEMGRTLVYIENRKTGFYNLPKSGQEEDHTRQYHGWRNDSAQ